MDDIAIKVEHVSKTFKLPHEQVGSVKHAIVNFAGRKKGYEIQQVLQDVSFEIKKGEFFGIVGRNGSGKSTLLKMLSGIYTPTGGSIATNGKLTPFIELGVGFNPELTGRENVFLNGALLGFNRKEMQAMYNDIVEFAELERFMDQKLKNYSSGMQVRLAFSIAIRAKTDILVLDEVLAVGDEAFQQKCINIFENYKSTNQTIVLVTHDMNMVTRFCSRAMLIDKGDIVALGDPEKVALQYTALNNEKLDDELAKKNAKARGLLKVELRDGPTVTHGSDLHLVLDWTDIKVPVRNVGVAIYKNSGEYVFGTNTIIEKLTLTNKHKAVYTVKAALGVGNYHFRIGLFGKTDRDIVFFMDDGPQFAVKDKSLQWQGIVQLEHNWELGDV